MNLIEDRWIPARRRSGRVEQIAPNEITDRYGEDPVVDVASPRPDFDGAMLQFLIGLLQTTMPPPDTVAWVRFLRTPPDLEFLASTFRDLAPAFFLDGNGPRFMQDLSLEDEIAALDEAERDERIKPIGDLLIDAPTGKTIRDNTDLFVKRGSAESLCLPCSAMALFTLQTNAPSGGQGHRTGIRGGGPMTTLVAGASLWETCWLNVLESPKARKTTGGQEKCRLEDRYPWLAPTRTSEGEVTTTPEDADPLQLFWAMPRRIRLSFSGGPLTCGICGSRRPEASTNYVTKNFGINYMGPWMHPLSPHFLSGEGNPSPRHPQPGGIGYRDWLGLLYGRSAEKSRQVPAAVVERYLRAGASDLRIRAFGYDMDKMKARSWFDGTMPLLLCPAEIREEFCQQVTALVLSAELAAIETRGQVKKALFGSGTEARGDLSFVSSRFWAATEPAFFALLPAIRERLLAGDTSGVERLRWHADLVRASTAIFDDLSQVALLETANPKRIALAWRNLSAALHGKKMRQALGLPEKPKPGTPKKSRQEA